MNENDIGNIFAGGPLDPSGIYCSDPMRKFSVYIGDLRNPIHTVAICGDSTCVEFRPKKQKLPRKLKKKLKRQGGFHVQVQNVDLFSDAHRHMMIWQNMTTRMRQDLDLALEQQKNNDEVVDCEFVVPKVPVITAEAIKFSLRCTLEDLREKGFIKEKIHEDSKPDVELVVDEDDPSKVTFKYAMHVVLPLQTFTASILKPEGWTEETWNKFCEDLKKEVEKEITYHKEDMDSE